MWFQIFVSLFWMSRVTDSYSLEEALEGIKDQPWMRLWHQDLCAYNLLDCKQDHLAWQVITQLGLKSMEVLPFRIRLWFHFLPLKWDQGTLLVHILQMNLFIWMRFQEGIDGYINFIKSYSELLKTRFKMKLWQKEVGNKKEVGVLHDRSWTLSLIDFSSFWCASSMAHAQMLSTIGLWPRRKMKTLQSGLKAIYYEIEKGQFEIAPGVEDIHSQVEFLLTERFGDVGKKLPFWRSRQWSSVSLTWSFIIEQPSVNW